MKDGVYNVILKGIQPGRDAVDVKCKLAEAFRSDPDRIDAILKRLPVTLKTGVDARTASKYQKAIADAGGLCELVPAEDPGEEPLRLEGFEKKSESRSQVLRTCPKCGYHAVSADDPLLTAHGGKGECPACNIIVDKFLADTRPDAIPSSTSANRSAEDDEGLWASVRYRVLSHPWQMLLILLVMMVAAGYPLFSKKSSPGVHGGKPAPVAERSDRQPPMEAVAEGPASDAERILPGEYRRLVLTVYLPLFHASSYTPLSMTVLAGKGTNSWEERGVSVEIESTNVTPAQVELWETKRESDQSWLPYAPFTYITFKSYTNPKSDREGLLRCNGLGDVLKAADLSREAVQKKLKSTYHSPPELGRSSYILYQAEATLAIRVPPGAEFSTRELQRTLRDGSQAGVSELRGKMGIHFFAINFDLSSIDIAEANLLPASVTGAKSAQNRGRWQATKLTLPTDVWIQLALLQRAEEDGVLVNLSGSRTLTSLRWLD
jgi:hypothetical protein